MFAAQAGVTPSTSGAGVYVDDVFSTYLYEGTSMSANAINNGIDLLGNGGMTWFKNRSSAQNNTIKDSARGDYTLITNDQGGQNIRYGFDYKSYGLDINTAQIDANESGNIYVVWSFRKQSKFFDVVTYTGNGSNRTIAHNLSAVPGCIIVKRTDTAGDWQVYHRGISNTEYMVLNTAAAKATGATRWNSTTPTSSDFTVGTDTTVNANGGTYVAYLFAHNAGGFGLAGTENVVSCGSFTTDGSGAASVTLDYEPQWLLAKASSTSQDWFVLDHMRGVLGGATQAAQRILVNAANAESSSVADYSINSTGFTASGLAASATYVYIAVRRPNKPPSAGTSVFQPTVYTGTNVDNRLVNTTIAPDMVWVRQRNDTVLGGLVIGDRMRGQPYLLTGNTDAEVNDGDAFDKQIVSTVEYGTAFSSMNGFYCGNDVTAKLNIDTTSNNHIAEAFKRAPGFFDVVCYTGNGVSGRQIPHNLTVKPELMIVKMRDASYVGISLGFFVYCPYALTGNPSGYGELNSTTGWSSFSMWSTAGAGVDQQTSSNIVLTDYPGINYSGSLFVAYLFATLVGISKVGSYTGNGSNQTINCSFTTGARFVLIKRTDAGGGDWFVWDSARGIVAGNDPHLSANSTAAEVTTDDSIDADNSGFVVNQVAGINVNVNTATYIYLAIA